MLRDYQTDLLRRIAEADGNVMAVAPCGAGKTVMMAHVARSCGVINLAIAHRRELVWQISGAFAAQGLPHRIIAPQAVVDDVARMHVEQFGRRWVQQDAPCAVASVDAMLRRPSDPFWRALRLFQIDEAHHCIADNKWGRAVAMLPQARGVGWTATPTRSDRKPLRSVWTHLVCGPAMRELIDRGFLTPYRIYGLPQAIDTANVRIGADGDFNQRELSGAAHASAITGDIVEHYQRYANGLSGVTFAVDVALAEEHAQAFRAAGIPAVMLCSATKPAARAEILRAFRNRELLQVCNVDILGEGFDMPRIEVASLARPTMSLGLFIQQCGRALRPAEGKSCGIILDHVGNVIRHGLPDRDRQWSLDVPARKKSVARLEVVIRVCASCLQPYEGFEPLCPFCGAEREHLERNRPEAVEGDLTLYTPELLAALRGEVERIAGPEQIPYGMEGNAAIALTRTWNNRQDAQLALSKAVDAWAGYWVARGESVRACYTRFYHTFGMDTLSALTQSGSRMLEMVKQVSETR